MSPHRVLDDICRRGVIRVGFQRHTPPFSYAVGTGFTPIGYSVDLARQVVRGVAHRAGRDIEIQAVEVTSSTREALLAQGEIDIECGSTTITRERSLRVEFSRPIFHTLHRIAIKADRPRVDGEGLCVTGITESTSHRALLDDAGTWPGLRFYGRPSISAAFEAFRDDEAVDAIVADEIILTALLRQHASTLAKLLDKPLGGEQYGFMMRRNDPAFAAEVDRELALALGPDSFHPLHATWFSQALPGLGFDLGMKVSDELLRALGAAAPRGT
jgi:glutamate/aspartate transport system substrate-binding protein